MDVGFIGLGQMGLPMARNLLKAGHTLTVYNRTRAKAEELRPEGARIAGEPSEACKGDALITILADDRAVDEVLFGNQLISKLPPSAVHISMGTISVTLAKRLAATHAEAGNQFVSAPVFGRPQAAEAAKLV